MTGQKWIALVSHAGVATLSHGHCCLHTVTSAVLQEQSALLYLLPFISAQAVAGGKRPLCQKHRALFTVENQDFMAGLQMLMTFVGNPFCPSPPTHFFFFFKPGSRNSLPAFGCRWFSPGSSETPFLESSRLWNVENTTRHRETTGQRTCASGQGTRFILWETSPGGTKNNLSLPC